MPFNIALTGLRASSIDLEVTGNNIANASTTGFKQARAEFGDLYASSFLGLGQASSGDGVRVQDIRQQFSQGNITITDNSLDLAIDGNGFFVLNSVNGDALYTRAGSFFTDKEGNIVNSQGSHLRGFPANEEGIVSGVLDDLVIPNTSLAPLRTTDVDLNLNIDASEEILLQRFESLVSSTAGGPVGFDLTAVPAVEPVNELAAQQVTFTYPDGSTEVVNIAADYEDQTNAGPPPAANVRVGNANMQNVAAFMSNLNGVSASAVSSVNMTSFLPPTGTTGMSVRINGAVFDGITSPIDLGNAINSSSSLIGVNATIDINDDLIITQTRGSDLTIAALAMDGGSFSLGTNAVAEDEAWVVGGSLTLTYEEGITVADTTTLLDGVTLDPATGPFTSFTGTTVVSNEFDPLDEETYNHATSTTIYDSLGNSHILTMYFVKESAGATISNQWTLYPQVDGQDVGNPLSAGDPATRAGYALVFNQDGTLDATASDEVIITNWLPLDSEGNQNGADTPLNQVVNPGDLLITEPPSSSNFIIDINDITQYGSDFSILDLQQNGYTTGLLNGLDVAQDGIVFARFSNGESQVLGQVALANFNSVDGLSPVGETAWVETFDSGGPIVGTPGSASLGTISASSLEESNVDLSEELVSLIIAQRNYQANAKTIETANATTQTIINLR